MFGDTAVFVNPKDKRYKDFVGKKVINPANGQNCRSWRIPMSI
jgi:valyl-tRNA synthetase